MRCLRRSLKYPRDAHRSMFKRQCWERGKWCPPSEWLRCARRAGGQGARLHGGGGAALRLVDCPLACRGGEEAELSRPSPPGICSPAPSRAGWVRHLGRDGPWLRPRGGDGSRGRVPSLTVSPDKPLPRAGWVATSGGAGLFRNRAHPGRCRGGPESHALGGPPGAPGCGAGREPRSDRSERCGARRRKEAGCRRAGCHAPCHAGCHAGCHAHGRDSPDLHKHPLEGVFGGSRG